MASENKQLAINILAQVAVFALSLGINFFLTPFVVKHLGVDAYGFVGLSNSIIGYMQVLTVALNSMAGRFITIEYHKGNIYKANLYYSSVFYANLILGGIILFISLLLVAYLEYFIKIPVALVGDVKLLFLLLSFNAVLTLVFNVFTLAPFIKNKLEVSAIRNIFSTFIRVAVLIITFVFFQPHLWYIGLAGLFYSLFFVITNVRIQNRLTPELIIRKKYFDFHSIKTVLSVGIWNLINKISTLLEKGFDLLLANWLISNTAMGLVSITTQITILIPQVINLISSSFAPSLTKNYAEEDMEGLKRNVYKSIKFMSVLTVIPLAVLYSYGDAFFSLWIPEQDNSLLHLILVLTTLDFIIGMPLEIFWSIFTVTNKVKVPSLVMLMVGVMTIVTLITLLSIFKDPTIQILCLASTRTVWNLIKNLTFLPIYGAKCLTLPWNFFYRSISKPLLSVVLSILVCMVFRFFYMPNSWLSFINTAFIVAVLAFVLSSLLIFEKKDIERILAMLKMN